MSWIVAAVLRWLALAGLFLFLAGSLSRSEVAAASLTGAAATALSLLLRRVAERQFDLHLPWPRLLGRVSWSLLRDLILVLGILTRVLVVRRRGRRVRRDSERRQGPAAQAGHRAMDILTRSIAPNEYVLDEDSQTLLLHRLAHPPRHRDEAQRA